MEFSKRLDLFGDEIFAALNERKVAQMCIRDRYMHSIYSKYGFVKRMRKKIHPPSKTDSRCIF